MLRRNEVNADKNYKGKIINLKGVVYDIDSSFASRSTVRLTDEGGFNTNIYCRFSKTERDNVAELVKGEDISVQGKVDGISFMNIYIENCKVK